MKFVTWNRDLILNGMAKGKIHIREWSLTTGRGGGLQNRRGGGVVKFYSYKRGGGGREKVFVGTTSFEVVLTQELEVLAILIGGGGGQKVSTLEKGGGRKKCPPLKRGGGVQEVLPCLEGGGGAQVLDPRFSQNVQELCRTCFCLNELCFMEYCQLIYRSFSDDSFSLFYVLWLEDQGPEDTLMIILFLNIFSLHLPHPPWHGNTLQCARLSFSHGDILLCSIKTISMVGKQEIFLCFY